MLARTWNATLAVVHALETPIALSNVPSWQEPPDPRVRAREQVRLDLGAHAAGAEVIVERGKAADLVLEVAARISADLIITGVARNEFMEPTKLGTTVETLARRSPVPVLVVKTRDHGPYRRIVVASEFSEASRVALVTALELFRDSRVTLFHGVEVPYESHVTDRVSFREGARIKMEEHARQHLADAGLATRNIAILCEYGRPDALLGDLARTTGIDLLVTGRGRGPIAAFFLGSVSMSLLRAVPTDVMVVPPGAAAELTARPRRDHELVGNA